MELLTAVAPEISDMKLQFIILSDPDGLPADIIRLLQKTLAPAVKILPCRSQGKLPVFPVNQLHAQFFFQRPYLLGYGGLGYITLLRRLSKAAAFHNSSKILHLSKQQRITLSFIDVPFLYQLHCTR